MCSQALEEKPPSRTEFASYFSFILPFKTLGLSWFLIFTPTKKGEVLWVCLLFVQQIKKVWVRLGPALHTLSLLADMRKLASPCWILNSRKPIRKSRHVSTPVHAPYSICSGDIFSLLAELCRQNRNRHNDRPTRFAYLHKLLCDFEKKNNYRWIDSIMESKQFVYFKTASSMHTVQLLWLILYFHFARKFILLFCKHCGTLNLVI